MENQQKERRIDMSTLIGGKSPVCKEICDALGLKHVRKLDIHMAYDKVVTIEAELFPEENGMRQLVSILKKYHLLEVKETKKEIDQDKNMDG